MFKYISPFLKCFIFFQCRNKTAHFSLLHLDLRFTIHTWKSWKCKLWLLTPSKIQYVDVNLSAHGCLQHACIEFQNVLWLLGIRSISKDNVTCLFDLRIHKHTFICIHAKSRIEFLIVASREAQFLVRTKFIFSFLKDP